MSQITQSKTEEPNGTTVTYGETDPMQFDQARYDAFLRRYDECDFAEDPRQCRIELSHWVYDQYQVDIYSFAAAKEENPLGGKSRELETLSTLALYEYIENPYKAPFLAEIGLDPTNIWNYDPAYFQALKAMHTADYEKAQREVDARMNEVQAVDRFGQAIQDLFEYSPPSSAPPYWYLE